MATFFETQSPFQKIEIKHHYWLPGEYLLFLDDSWQLDTSVEARYHESLITIPYAAAPALTRTLICGGGDGMSLREAVRFPTVEVDMVEIDPVMIETFTKFDFLNGGAFKNRRAHVRAADAVKYVDELPQHVRYDVVSLDFPSPTSKNTKKGYFGLYHPDILKKFLRVLKPHGVLSSQVSIRNDLLCTYIQTLLNEKFYVHYYDVHYTRKGNHDSFLIASRTKLRRERNLPPGLRFVSNEHVESAVSDVTAIAAVEMNHFRLFSFTENADHEME